MNSTHIVKKLIFILLTTCFSTSISASEIASFSPPVIVIHGGAGTLKRANMSAEIESSYRSKLKEAIQSGYKKLQEGGTSIDAVITAINILESSPLFNAGVGSVLNWDGEHELDAAIMDGESLKAGAVAGVRRTPHPINLAHAIMKKSEFVLLSGSGADDYAASLGFPRVNNSFFTTKKRVDDLAKHKNKHKLKPSKWGTVGAVALDQYGNLAAGTSTGGRTGKRFGRIGDSPLIGAGTYANNDSCAVSATGHGEYFIRYHVAADICARIRYTGVDVKTAGQQVIFDQLKPAGGTGGVIILDRSGNLAMVFNTRGMYRAAIDRTGQLTVKIYGK